MCGGSCSLSCSFFLCYPKDFCLTIRKEYTWNSLPPMFFILGVVIIITSHRIFISSVWFVATLKKFSADKRKRLLSFVKSKPKRRKIRNKNCEQSLRDRVGSTNYDMQSSKNTAIRILYFKNMFAIVKLWKCFLNLK